METTPKELDAWIARLEECKQLEENQVKILCNKVCLVKASVAFCEPWTVLVSDGKHEIHNCRVTVLL